MPHSICTEVSAKSVLQREKSGSREDIKGIMRVEESKDFGSRSVSKSHSFIRGESTKAVGLKLYGVLERKKQYNAVRTIWRIKIQIPKPRIGCRGYYVDTVGKNEKRIEEYVRNQLKEDELGEQIKMPLNGPFTGSK